MAVIAAAALAAADSVVVRCATRARAAANIPACLRRLFTQWQPFFDGFSGGGSVLTTHPYGPHGGPGWSQSIGHWNSGQNFGNHWNWNRNGNFFIYPYFFSFIPVYGYGYGYGYPYYDYGGPSTYYAVYYNGENGQPPLNGPQAVDPAAPVGPVRNAAPQAGERRPAIADGNDADANPNAGSRIFRAGRGCFPRGPIPRRPAAGESCRRRIASQFKSARVDVAQHVRTGRHRGPATKAHAVNCSARSPIGRPCSATTAIR